MGPTGLSSRRRDESVQTDLFFSTVTVVRYVT